MFGSAEPMPADRLIHPRLGHSVKVCSLSDFEHRVWLTYELAADDYGVMRLSATTVKSANEAFDNRSDVSVQRALERLVEVGLVVAFTHQGRRYCCQRDWQNYQRVKHPRDTMQPLPDDAVIATCTAATQKLFVQHPSKRSAELPEDFGKVSEGDRTEKSELGSLARARTRETANGYRPMAHGLEEQKEAPSFFADVAIRELQAAYPQNRVTYGARTEHAFIDQLHADGQPEATYVLMRANLEIHKASHEWRVKGMAPALEKWLRDGLWKRQMDEQAPVAEQLSPKTNRTLAAAAEILKGKTA